MYIDNQDQYQDFINKAKRYNKIAIDTEFIREKTYWPKLCLLQLAIEDQVVLVDPFKVDIVPIKDILANDKIVKIFHSPRQDLEILLYKTKVMPNNVFDTQTAASFLGFNDQIGYANLVNSILNIKLDKSDTYSDWTMRPLSKSQLKYAKNDVYYLLEIYPIIINKLAELGRTDWVKEDIAEKYLDAELYNVSPEKRFMHVKRISSLCNRQLACAKEVAACREQEAIKLNLPRRWVLSDESIIEICKSQPKNIDQLFKIRGLKSKLSMDFSRKLIAAVTKAMSYQEKDFPDLNSSSKHSWKRELSLNSNSESALDLMNAIVAFRAKESNLASSILSSNSDLVKILSGVKSGIPTLSGWRKKLIGNELLDFVDGKIGLSYKDGQVVIKDLDK